MGVWSLIGVITGSLVSVWAFFKFIVTQKFRLDDNISKNLLPFVQSLNYKFELNNEFSINKKYPSTYSAFAIICGIPIFYSRDERLLTAGWQSKELISELYYFRWHKKKIIALINKIANNQNHTNVMALMPWGSDKLGQLTKENNPKIYIDDSQYKDIELDIEQMLVRKSGKTSALLYGKPGTGKTRLVKYLSIKYNLPIYSVFLNPEYNNFDILSMFADVPERCIVLFEDFDNYFNKRECIMKHNEVKFTFDVLLSVLDGVYNEYNQVFFVMTCNDIDKMDDSLKDRPSRFKFVREITGPSYAKRLEILDGNIELAELTDGMTTDKVFFAKSMAGSYSNSEIMDKINA